MKKIDDYINDCKVTQKSFKSGFFGGFGVAKDFWSKKKILEDITSGNTVK